MPSSKGKPTDPKLREELKEKIKQQPNSDGGGKGQWSAWKAAKLGKEYEKQGGGYENEPGSKNEPRKGTPQPKSTSKKDEEEQGSEKQPRTAKLSDKKARNRKEGKLTASNESSNSQATPTKSNTSKKRSPAREGTRRSSRVQAKRAAEDDSKILSTNGSNKKHKSSK